MDPCAAEVLGRHGLVRHGPDDVRPGHEHVARVPHHDDEVRHGGRVDVAAGAGPHDDRNLRDDARTFDVAPEHLAVAAERRDALLDAGAAGIEQSDDRRPHAQRHVLHLGYLARMGLAERAAEHREILREDEDRATVDRAPPSYDAVSRDFLPFHAEICRAVFDIHVELLERVRVEQEFDALAGRQLAAPVLGRDAPFAAARRRLRAAPVKVFDHVAQEPPSCSEIRHPAAGPARHTPAFGNAECAVPKAGKEPPRSRM